MTVDQRKTFSPAELDTLRDHYARIHLIDPASESYKKLTRVLDASSVPMLQQLWNARIKFVSMLARNWLKKRGIEV